MFWTRWNVARCVRLHFPFNLCFTHHPIPSQYFLEDLQFVDIARVSCGSSAADFQLVKGACKKLARGTRANLAIKVKHLATGIYPGTPEVGFCCLF